MSRKGYEGSIELPDDMDSILKAIGFGKHEGYAQHFTRAQAEGAYVNGSVIRKVNSELEDTNLDGTQGVVLGSLKSPVIGPNGYFSIGDDLGIVYFIEWETMPGIACAVPGRKVGELLA